MAPPPAKLQRRNVMSSDNFEATRKTVVLSRSQSVVDQNYEPIVTRAKRKADAMLKDDKSKRLALGNLPNNILPVQGKNVENDCKKPSVTKLSKKVDRNNVENCAEPVQKSQTSVNLISSNRICTRATTAAIKAVYNPGLSLLPIYENTRKRSLSVSLTEASKSENSLQRGTSIGIFEPIDSVASSSSSSTSAEVSSSKSAELSTSEKEIIESKVENPTELTETLHEQKPSVNQVLRDSAKSRFKPPGRRITDDFEKSDESLYMSALEDSVASSTRLSGLYTTGRRSISDFNANSSLNKKQSASTQDTNTICSPSPSVYSPSRVPKDIVDFDKENWNDPYQVSEYAMDIFEYLKDRELDFTVNDYMPKQQHISKWMRSLLVDWMVEVQETFELNHETLYLSVKLVDIYLSKVIIIKDKLQLLGAAALFIACKYDERTPPLIDDFRYICDGAYDRQDLLKMEMDLLKEINFNLGVPLSYRFLRRYARVAKIEMPTLTLARYILELSLIDYSIITFRDSLVACAALFIALKMKGEKIPWSKTLEFYTGYIIDDFCYIIALLNANLHRKRKSSMKTISNKYSHELFFQVAKISLLTTEELLGCYNIANALAPAVESSTV